MEEAHRKRQEAEAEAARQRAESDRLVIERYMENQELLRMNRVLKLFRKYWLQAKVAHALSQFALISV